MSQSGIRSSKELCRLTLKRNGVSSWKEGFLKGVAMERGFEIWLTRKIKSEIHWTL